MPEAVDGDGREYSAAVVAAFTGVATFLGGFAFAALTVLLSLDDRSAYFQTVFVVTAVTTLVWVAVAALGAFLSVATRVTHLLRGSPLLRIATAFTNSLYAALLLLFINVAMLAFLVSASVGVIASVAATVVATALGAAVLKIAQHW